MTWQINIPFSDRNQALDVSALEDLRFIRDAEQRAVARHLMFEGIARGDGTVGELLDRIETAGPEERRQMLNEARAAADLPSAEAVDARREMAMRSQALMSRGVPERDEAGLAYLFCSVPDCRNFPVSPSGAHALTNVRKWWCEKHRDQAADGDMDPWRLNIRYSASGAIEYVAEVEAEQHRQEREAERLRVRREREAAERAPEAERAREHQDALAEHYRSKGGGWE